MLLLIVQNVQLSRRNLQPRYSNRVFPGRCRFVMSQALHSYAVNGLVVTTGDIICTSDGGGPTLPGEFWRLVGKLIPGEVDHIVVYIGPEGRCIEAGPRGVISFDIPEDRWNAGDMYDIRWIADSLVGIASPLKQRGLFAAAEAIIRTRVAEYCLSQLGKPYNLNFLNSRIESAFYCSQLAYMAYLSAGIDLNTNRGVPDVPGTESIIFPQELWEGTYHERI